MTHLEHIVLGNRISLCVLCIIMREKEDILGYALHRRIVMNNVMIFQLRV